MKKYIVVFITEDAFAVELVVAETLVQAIIAFMHGSLQHDEIYSITLVR